MSKAFTRTIATPAVVLLAAVLLAGCAYRGGIDDPLVQKTSWFSFLNGDDIRRTCAAGTPPQYRLVYNGRYVEQVRTYDLVGDGAGGAILVARVQGPADWSRLTTGDLLEPWRWETSRTRLSPPEVDGFEAALRQSGFFAPAPRGLRLDSRRFYWLGVACRDGRIWFNAWQHPDPGFGALTFPAWLARVDETGVPFYPPRAVDPGERLAERAGGDTDRTVNFELTVGENGLAGLLTPL